jgi:hypothetical protein
MSKVGGNELALTAQDFKFETLAPTTQEKPHFHQSIKPLPCPLRRRARNRYRIHCCFGGIALTRL